MKKQLNRYSTINRRRVIVGQEKKQTKSCGRLLSLTTSKNVVLSDIEVFDLLCNKSIVSRKPIINNFTTKYLYTLNPGHYRITITSDYCKERFYVVVLNNKLRIVRTLTVLEKQEVKTELPKLSLKERYFKEQRAETEELLIQYMNKIGKQQVPTEDEVLTNKVIEKIGRPKSIKKVIDYTNLN
jgi:hypothetical protein